MYCCLLDNAHSSEEKVEISDSAKITQENPLGDNSQFFLQSNKNNDGR